MAIKWLFKGGILLRILEFFGMVPPEYGGRHTGGADYVVWELSKAFVKLGHEVYMMTTIPYEGSIVEGVRAINERKLIRNLLSCVKPRTNHRILELGKKYGFDPDYVRKMAVEYWAFHEAAKILIEKLKPDVVHLHGVTIDRLPTIEAALPLPIPKVLTLHGLLGFATPSGLLNAPKNMEKRKDYEKDILHEFLERAPDLVITTVSREVRREAVEYYGIPEIRIFSIPNGVGERFFNPTSHEKRLLRMRFKFALDKKIFLTVGSYSRRKNQILILKALKLLGKRSDELEYIMIGKGPEKATFEDFIRKNGINSARIMGPMFGQNLVDVYWASDFFILTSLSEGQPLVFLEAMAAGLPIVTMKSLEGVEDVYDEKAFLVVRKYSPEAVANAMIKAMAVEWDREYIRLLARKYIWIEVAKNYTKLFDRIIKGNII